MTENEAKEFLERFSLDRIGYANGKEVDIERFNYFTNVLNTAISALQEIQQYRLIGTVSECREAVEKQRAKKPIIKSWSPAICPMCGEELSESLDDGYYKHLKTLKVCPKCFQRLDWSDTP